jgi:gliding motility-associated-like protein
MLSFQLYSGIEELPNVFTPNGDGFNDVFETGRGHCPPYKLIIYNRWGAKVFETEKNEEYWNGKTRNGLDAAEGTYYYVLQTGAKSFSGTVTLLR